MSGGRAAGRRRPPSRLQLAVGPGEAGLALARFVARRGGIDEAEARTAIERGGAFVDGRRARDPGRPVKAGERVEVGLRERGELPRAPGELEPARLLHCDAQLLAVDKPAGVLAQEGRAGGPSLPELAERLLARQGQGGPALLVHRLDRGTTGVALLARTRAAQAHLLEEFRAGRVEKEYRALVAGRPEADSFEVDLALGPDPAVPHGRRPDPAGEAAHTRVAVLERLGGAALVACRPTTGRTHQIRVHLAARRLPLLGDVRYGGPRHLTAADGTRLELARPLLHARSLALRHPGGGRLLVQAPEPADLLLALAFLRAARPPAV